VEPELVDALLDGALGLEVLDARVAVGAAHAGEGQVLDSALVSGLGEVDALLDRRLVAVFPEVRGAEHGVDVLERGFDAVGVVEIVLEDVRGGALEFERGVLAGVAGEQSHVEGLVAEQGSGDGPALCTGGAGDEHGRGLGVGPIGLGVGHALDCRTVSA
jgi:hypothetical protein